MMLAALVTPAGERGFLPDRTGRPTPWVIAIMMFVTLVVAAAGLAMANAARVLGDSVTGRYSIQIPGGARTAPVAVATARRVPGVLAVNQVPEADIRATLQSWLGPEAASAGLPLPALIDVDLQPGADPIRMTTQVRRAVPQARVLAYSEQLGPVTGSLRALQWLALGLVLLMTAATAATVVLATRGAFDTHRSTIEIMHGIGATDEQLARLFQRRLARDALVGGVVGGAAAALVLLLVRTVPGSLLNDLGGGPVLRPLDWFLLALLPLLGTLVAMLVARTTVLKALRRVL
ncbi:MAG: Assymetric_cell_division_FstX [uncultured Sphingomonas sp.]|uniref:Assymetric_cell_division_FstX n=1 Tax=uncultured Sphingomonas sp. TaxID=158754 RepID=A0A6J4S651_9SPHN|nr:cell division protein [uncultured Sphingomonas sp.]CAA9487281.1 MAG: Assymetric_cell_division_FstX [uncultured Sphingomonas sp.]